MTEAEKLAYLVESAERLLAKFHIETDCGLNLHWAECEALRDALDEMAGKEQ